MKRKASPFVVIIFALAGQIASSHHSSSMYDLETVNSLDGVVTRYEWANPHVYVYVEARQATGEPVEWRIEAGATALMRLRGWSEGSLEPGERVTVAANLHRNPARHAGLGQTITKADGRVLRVSGPPAEVEEVPVFAAMGLSGNWLPSGEALVHFLGGEQGPASWPLTERGRTVLESYTEADNPAAATNAGKDCAPLAAPVSMIFPVLTTIDVRDNIVSMHMAITGDVERIVLMNVDSHEDAGYTYQGHSIGHWEDSALIVDTVNFATQVHGNAEGLASGSRKHVTERFELAPDRTSLIYSYVLDDPEYLSEPITGSMNWTYRPDLQYLAQPCDLENARRYLD